VIKLVQYVLKEFKTISAPENVIIFDYRTLERFLNGLTENTIPLKTSPEKKRKLEALAKCTFENREELKERFRQGRNLDYLQRSIHDFLSRE